MEPILTLGLGHTMKVLHLDMNFRNIKAKYRKKKQSFHYRHMLMYGLQKWLKVKLKKLKCQK